MKLISCLYDLNTYQQIKSYSDGIVVYSSDFSSFYSNGLKKEEIHQLIEINQNDKQIFINIEFMLENYEINDITNFILEFKDKNVYFIYSDLGVFQILKENDMLNFGIYNPNTLITNDFDMNFYTSLGTHGVNLSLEITLEDQKEMLKNKSGHVMMQVYGYHLMFHSKRHLVSLYKEFLNKDFTLDNYNSYLIEQTRKDKYHIFESNRGTSLFRPYVLSYLENLNDLSNLDYAFLDNIFIDYDTYLEVLKTYHGYLNQNITLDEALFKLNSLNLEYNDGFKYEDTVYQKEAISCKR